MGTQGTFAQTVVAARPTRKPACCRAVARGEHNLLNVLAVVPLVAGTAFISLADGVRVYRRAHAQFVRMGRR
jgi:hypothetical protein